MRVGVNTLFLIPGEVGGSETYLRGLLPALTGVEPSLELVIFTNRENHDSFGDFERVPIGVNAVSRPMRILKEQCSLPGAVRRSGVDLLFSAGYTAPYVCPCPQVVTIHDVQYAEFPDEFSWASLQAQRLLVGMAAKRAVHIITVSEFSKEQITKHLRVPKEKISVTYEAPADEFYDKHEADARPPYIVYVSNTYPHKNAPLLVEAFGQIVDEIEHELLIVGQPRNGEPPPHPRMRRIHRMPFGELVGLVQGADLMVFPSLYEGFGLPVIEAMAAGTRVTASRVASIPELGGEAISYFDPHSADSIASAIKQALLESPEQRSAMIEKARERAGTFTWKRCAEQTIKAFGRTLAT